MFRPKNVLKSRFLTQKCPKMTMFYLKTRHFKKTILYSGEVAFPGENRHGYPFTWMLRDMLQFNSTGDAALETMQNADRTCNLILGVGDGKPESQVFHGVSSDADLLTVYTDTYLMPKVNDDGVDMTHEDIENVVYWGMDWFCPPFHKQLHDRIVANWGAITAENTMRDIIPRTNTGNMHIAVYDYNNWDMYVAFARQSKYRWVSCENYNLENLKCVLTFVRLFVCWS